MTAADPAHPAALPAHPPAPHRFGPALLPGGGTAFALWAPSLDAAALESTDRAGRLRDLPLRRDADGWHTAVVADAGAGTRYRFVVGDGLRVPDPASRHNPDGPHGPSVVVDPVAYRWATPDWRGRPWHEAVICELHVGCFTPEGTFAAAAERLPALADAGFTAVELMPVAAFGGARNWGYDGVLPFAPHAGYGTPDDLKRFVDRAHGLGLMVLLDVVYNHFGPDGNYLHAYCPEFFNAAERTPWGPAINVDGAASATVRRFFVDNARHWVDEFRFDGLRLDAVHQIRDRSARHLIDEIAAALYAIGAAGGRHVHLVLENDANEAARLADGTPGAAPAATAQWNDDLHHAAHVLATGEADGYYADFAAAPLQQFGRALAEGFAYQGEPSRHRGAAHGTPSAHLPPTAFVAFLQNHDQIGNRAFGERLDALATPARVEALLACVLLAPQVPMLFMGEEFGATTPFLYFCDFDGALGAAVAAGRRAEFARFRAFADATARAAIPDPTEARTFARSRLDWRERDAPAQRARLAFVGRLLALRRDALVPRLAGAPGGGGRWHVEGGLLRVDWTLGDGSGWQLVANLGDAAASPAAASLAPTPVVEHGAIERCGGGASWRFAPDAVRIAHRPARFAAVCAAPPGPPPA